MCTPRGVLREPRGKVAGAADVVGTVGAAKEVAGGHDEDAGTDESLGAGFDTPPAAALNPRCLGRVKPRTTPGLEIPGPFSGRFGVLARELSGEATLRILRI
jgi:hypothetical protein